MEQINQNSQQEENINEFFMEQNEEPENMLNQDIETLIRIIYQEKACPYLIPYQKQIIEAVMETCQMQELGINNLEEEEEQRVQKREDGQQIMANFQIHLYKYEIQRIKYIIKTYLKIRLMKIQKFAQYIVQQGHHLSHQQDSKQQQQQQFLSSEERAFLANYLQIRKPKFDQVLKNLPKQYQNLTVDKNQQTQQNNSRFNNIGPRQPQFNKYVFCLFSQTPPQEIEYGSSGRSQVIQTRRQKEGDIILASYKDIKALHENGTVELI